MKSLLIHSLYALALSLALACNSDASNEPPGLPGTEHPDVTLPSTTPLCDAEEKNAEPLPLSLRLPEQGLVALSDKAQAISLVHGGCSCGAALKCDVQVDDSQRLISINASVCGPFAECRVCMHEESTCTVPTIAHTGEYLLYLNGTPMDKVQVADEALASASAEYSIESYLDKHCAWPPSVPKFGKVCARPKQSHSADASVGTITARFVATCESCGSTPLGCELRQDTADPSLVWIKPLYTSCDTGQRMCEAVCRQSEVQCNLEGLDVEDDYRLRLVDSTREIPIEFQAGSESDETCVSLE